jgi:hypothetical protein
MMAEKKCTVTDNTAGAASALASAGSGKAYGPVRVDVLAVDAGTNTVVLRAPGSGDRNPVDVKVKWTRQNVFAGCPSSLDCDEKRLPEVGESGTLYLSRAVVEKNLVAAQIKWPDDLPGAGPEYRPLQIWPTSIQLTGVELATGTMTSGTIDLMDPNIAAPGQTLTLNDTTLTLNLSQVAFFRFFAPWASLDALQKAKETLNGTRSRSSARDKAQAWAQVAAWEDILGQQESPGDENHIVARRLLTEIQK